MTTTAKNSKTSGVVWLLAFLLAAIVFSIIILAAVPPVSRDALTHHLAVPQLYLQKGAIYEIPEIDFSYYPMNLDLLYLLALYFENDIAAKYIHFSFSLMTALLIFFYMRPRLGLAFSLLAALFFLSIPVVVQLSISVYVDLGLVFFTTASLLAFIKWLNNGFKIRYLVLSGICCGLALGTKYNGLIAFFLLTLFIPFWYVGKREQGSGDSGGKNSGQSARGLQDKSPLMACMGYVTLFLAVCLLLYAPWGIRNIAWTGNPIHPLYSKWLSPQEQVSSPELNHFVQRKLLYGESWWETALIPVRVFFQGRDDEPKYFDGRLNPFLVIFSIFALAGIRKDPARIGREKKIFFWFSLLYLLYAFVSIDMRIRYISPIIGPMVILSTMGISDAFRWIETKAKSKRLFTGMLIACVCVMLIINARYVVEQFKTVEPLSYLSGKVSRQAYIVKRRPEYEVLSLANKKLSPDSKIFGLFVGNRSYYSEREMVFGLKRFQFLLSKAQSAGFLVDSLQAMKVTHFLVGTRLFNQWAPMIFDTGQSEILDDFFKNHLRLLIHKNGFALYALPENGD